MLSWRRPETYNWDYKLFRKLFTEVINHVRSRVIFSSAYIQLEFLFETSGVASRWLLQVWVGFTFNLGISIQLQYTIYGLTQKMVEFSRLK